MERVRRKHELLLTAVPRGPAVRGGEAGMLNAMAEIDLRQHDWTSDRLVDSVIIEHGFARYLRDYDVVVDVPAAKPDGTASYISGRYRYRFTHCVEAHVETQV